MEAELKFIQSQPKGNRGRDKGRLKKYDDLVEAAAASRDAERVQSGAIAIAPGPRLGGFVVRAERLTRRVGEAASALARGHVRQGATLASSNPARALDPYVKVLGPELMQRAQLEGRGD